MVEKRQKVVKPNSVSSTTLHVSPESGTIFGGNSTLSSATYKDLSDSIGTIIYGVQLSKIQDELATELASLIAERGVVIFREQTFDSEAFTHLVKHLDPSFNKAHFKHGGEGSSDNVQQHTEWYSDGSHTSQPPSLSLLAIPQDTIDTALETAWISQYGMYDSLSKPLRCLFDGMTATHTSGSYSANHPVVRTHPLSRLRALNFVSGSVTRIVSLKKRESGWFSIFTTKINANKSKTNLLSYLTITRSLHLNTWCDGNGKAEMLQYGTIGALRTSTSSVPNS